MARVRVQVVSKLCPRIAEASYPRRLLRTTPRFTFPRSVLNYFLNYNCSQLAAIAAGSLE